MKHIALIMACATLAVTACGQSDSSKNTAASSAEKKDKAQPTAQSQAKTQPETQAETQAEKSAGEILAAYRVRGMMEQSAPIISDSLMVNLPAAVTKAQRDQLLKIVTQTYRADALIAQTNQHLTRAAEKADKTEYLGTAANALQSDLAQQMVDLDEEAATDEFAEGFAKFLETPPAEGAEQRVEQIEELVANLRLVELQTVFNLGLMRGMIGARNAASPEDYSMSQESADNMVAQTREGLDKHLNDQIPMMLFFAYREVEQTELDEYTQMQAQDALRWANEAMIQAMARTFDDAASKVAKRYHEEIANDAA